MANARLVTSHLEDVPYLVLEKAQRVVARMIHRKAGLYALYDRNGGLYYVGLTSSLNARLKQHLKDRHRGCWEKFSLYLTIRDDHMKELESLLLRIVSPPGNRVGGKFARAADLRPELNRLVKEEQDRQRASMLGGSEAERFRRRLTSKGFGRKALAGLFDRRMELRGRYKGKVIKASLRKNGQVRLGTKTFDSLSAAASHVGISRNGWNFWSYRDTTSGKWRPLHTVRK